MRVLHLVNVFNPSLGYREYYLAKTQLEKGIDLKVIAFQSNEFESTAKKAFQRTHGIQLHQQKYLLKIRGTIFIHNPFDLERIIRSYTPDVIHCHNLLSSYSQEVLFLKNKYRYSVVGDIITGLGSGRFSIQSRLILTKVIQNFLRKWLLNRTDAFFSCSEAVEKWLVNSLSFPSRKVYNIPLGADHRLFNVNIDLRKKTRSELGISEKDFLGIYTGKIIPSKKISDLLLASASILKNSENFKLLIVGDGTDKYLQELNTIIKGKNVSENIRFLKTVNRIQLPRYYNAADVAIWPGAFSISIMEAMACGLPIIITRSKWTSHCLEYENGYAFKNGDIKELEKLLLHLFNKPATRKQMGKRSRSLVEDKLNWERISDQYLDVYEKCMR